jgi:flagellar basal body-associated protein FliL
MVSDPTVIILIITIIVIVILTSLVINPITTKKNKISSKHSQSNYQKHKKKPSKILIKPPTIPQNPVKNL